MNVVLGILIFLAASVLLAIGIGRFLGATKTPRRQLRVLGDVPRVMTKEYLEARGEALEHGCHTDPIITDFWDTFSEDFQMYLWYAFMAGSDFERNYRGRRYEDEPPA